MTNQLDDIIEKMEDALLSKIVVDGNGGIEFLSEGMCAALAAAIGALGEMFAGEMENLGFFTDVEELLHMTKSDMSVKTCHEGASAIRTRAAEIQKELSDDRG